MSLIDDVLTAVAAIQTGMQNSDKTATIQYAYKYPHWEPNARNLPMFLNTWRGGKLKFGATGGLQFAELNVHMHLCVALMTQGASLAQMEEGLAKWPDSVFAAFASHFRLDQSGKFPELMQAQLSAYEPEEFVVVGTKGYLALRFELAVALQMSLPFGE